MAVTSTTEGAAVPKATGAKRMIADADTVDESANTLVRETLLAPLLGVHHASCACADLLETCLALLVMRLLITIPRVLSAATDSGAAGDLRCLRQLDHGCVILPLAASHFPRSPNRSHFPRTVGSTAGIVLLGTLAFKFVEMIYLLALPILGLFWGGSALAYPDWMAGELGYEEDAAEAAKLLLPIGALVCLASWGCLSAYFSGCAFTKAKMLPFVALVLFFSSTVKDRTDGTAMLTFVVGPVAITALNFVGPSLLSYMKKSQADAVAMSRKVHS